MNQTDKIPPEEAVRNLKDITETAKRLLSGQTQTKLNPKLRVIEYLNQELQRTHETIRVKLTNRECIKADEEELQAFRDKFHDAIADYQEAAKDTQ